MTSPVSGIGATPGTVPNQAQVDSATQKSATSMALDPQAFLKLMVAQLQYQDPTSPEDSSTFLTQSATLSEVQSMNSMMSTLSSLASAQQASAATALIGKKVTYLDASGASASGTVTSASLASTGAAVQIGSNTVSLSNVLTVS
jgi:flagellar basal-body rod modification protein FlgD